MQRHIKKKYFYFICSIITFAIFLLVFMKRYNVGRIVKYDYSTMQPVKIAIIDSDINEETRECYSHIIKEHVSFLEESNFKSNIDHGTKVTSIVCSNLENAEVFILEVIDENGYADVQNVIKSLEWCIDKEIDIINMSFGFNNDDKHLRKVVENVVENDIIILAAAGNNYGGTSEYPSAYNGVISVGALNENREISIFSAKKNVDVFTLGELDFAGEEKIVGTSFSTAIATANVVQFLNEKSNVYLSEKKIIEVIIKNSGGKNEKYNW